MGLREAMTADSREFYRQFLKALRYAMPPQNHEPMARLVAQAIDGICPSLGVGGERSALQRDGVQRVGAILRDSVIAEIGPFKIHDGWGRVTGEWGTLFDIPSSVHVAHYKSDAIAACHDLIYAATDPRVIGPITSYFGCLPTISYFCLWWSLAGRDKPEDAELYHVDKHDYRFAKLFIPLTGVDADSGPTDIIKGSHHIAYWQAKWGEVAIGNQDQSRFHAMCNAQRKADADIAHFFQPDEIETMTAESGEGYLADTSAWHRGRLPTKRNRLMFQALYTLLPDPKVEPQLLDVPGFERGWRERFGDALSAEQLRFITRMVLKSQPRGHT